MGNKRRAGDHQAKAAPLPSVKVENNGLLRDEIQLRAYYRYCERGCEPGSEIDDWLSAEQEVLAQRGDV